MKVTRWWMLLLVVVLLVVSSACTNDPLDDGDGADVLFQINSLTNSPVTATLDETSAICTYVVVDWTVAVSVVALNEIATTSPFNDVRMESVTIEYEWPNGVTTNPVVVGLGNVVVPVGGSGTVTFAPISFDDLFADPAIPGSTANVTLTIRGVTEENEGLTVISRRQLFVEDC